LEPSGRPGLIIAAIRCLAGLRGMVTASMRIRRVGIVGDAGVAPGRRSADGTMVRAQG
jgi:hypothetical protein